MLTTNNIEVYAMESAFRGMRNPMNSWDKSDSFMCPDGGCYFEKCPDFDVTIGGCHHNSNEFIIGNSDMNLACRLIKAGPSHRKFLRQIFISLDINAPLYWWKEFDQYKVATVTNSCSTMHKIHAKDFELNDFSHEHLFRMYKRNLESIIILLNDARAEYLATKDKAVWWQMIQMLPSSYNQLRTVTMDYETALNILDTRKGHKLDEWETLRQALLDNCPYLGEFYEALHD